MGIRSLRGAAGLGGILPAAPPDHFQLPLPTTEAVAWLGYRTRDYSDAMARGSHKKSTPLLHVSVNRRKTAQTMCSVPTLSLRMRNDLLFYAVVVLAVWLTVAAF